MIINPDGSIILEQDDARGIDALLSVANSRVRDSGVYTREDASKFSRQWDAIRLLMRK